MEHLVRNPLITPSEFDIVTLPPIDDAVLNAVKAHYDNKSVIIVTHSPANLPKEWKDACHLAIIANSDDGVSVATSDAAANITFEELERFDLYFPDWRKYELKPWYIS
jgi:hypothetical protein